MPRTTLRPLAAAAALATAAGMALGIPAQAQTIIQPPEDPCNINYFPDEDMWEISWGSPYYQQRYWFDIDSYGGLVSVNGGDVPPYMTDANTWHWWYITRAGFNAPGGARVDLGFEDGTHWRGEAVPDANGCPAVTWTMNPPADPDPDPTPGSLGSLTGSTVFGSIDVFGSLGSDPGGE